MKKKILIASLVIIFFLGIITVRAQNFNTIYDDVVKGLIERLYGEYRTNFIPNEVEDIGSSFMDNKTTLVGSSANYIRLPYYYVEDISTTTSGFTDGGLLTQQISTNGLDTVYLSISAIGAVSTSTMYIKPMVSFDGTNFFNIATSSDSLMGTTTANITNSFIRAFIPSTATSTKVFKFPEIKGSKYTRFIMYSDKLGDLNIGTKAWIEAIKFEGIVR